MVIRDVQNGVIVFMQLLGMIGVLAAGLAALAWWGTAPEREQQVARPGKESATQARDR